LYDEGPTARRKYIAAQQADTPRGLSYVNRSRRVPEG
jgi:hypothetical protein